MSEYSPSNPFWNSRSDIAVDPLTSTIKVEESIPVPSLTMANSISESRATPLDPSDGYCPEIAMTSYIIVWY